MQRSWKVTKTNNGLQSRIASTWFLVLLVMVLGGLTKHDQYEKFLWVCIGASAGLYRVSSNQPGTIGIA